MIETFHWDRSFETGIETVDEQHHHLVDLINAFGALLAENVIEVDAVERALEEMGEYANYHFTEEETMMRQAGIDPRHFTAHHREHELFMEDVAARRTGLREGDRAQAESLLQFLVYWLIYHILGTDQYMARQLASIRSGTDPAVAYKGQEHDATGPTQTLLSALHGLFRLLSERNRELRDLTATLEQKVDARTRELADANRLLEAMAMTDALTGLPNRRQAMKRLRLQWDEFVQARTPLSCLMIDADGFKGINDTHGHDSGDLVLTRLARTLQNAVRTDDVVARLGGDEFFVLLPKTGHRGAMTIAEKLREQAAELRVDFGSGEWMGSISVGVATCQPGMENGDDLVKAADRGLYLAKNAGRNRVRSLSSGRTEPSS